MKKILIAGLTGLALLAPPALAAAEPTPGPPATVAVKKARDCGDTTGVVYRKSFDWGEAGQWRIATRSRLRYRVPCSLAYLDVTHVWGKYNFEGSRVRCGGFNGMTFRFSFSDNREVSVRVPCDNDTVRAAGKRVHLRFYAQSPCPIGPVCPPATKYRVRHLINETGWDDRWTSPWTFIA